MADLEVEEEEEEVEEEQMTVNYLQSSGRSWTSGRR